MPFDENKYIGLTSMGSQDMATSDGYAWRVLAINGVAQVVTRDVRDDRVSVTIVDEVVVKAEIS